MNLAKLFLRLDDASDDDMTSPLSAHDKLQIFRPLFLLQNKKKVLVEYKLKFERFNEF